MSPTEPHTTHRGVPGLAWSASPSAARDATWDAATGVLHREQRTPRPASSVRMRNRRPQVLHSTSTTICEFSAQPGHYSAMGYSLIVLQPNRSDATPVEPRQSAGQMMTDAQVSGSGPWDRQVTSGSTASWFAFALY